MLTPSVLFVDVLVKFFFLLASALFYSIFVVSNTDFLLSQNLPSYARIAENLGLLQASVSELSEF